MQMTITLPFATPSNNEIMRMHHRERTRQHKIYQQEIWAASIGRRRNLERCRMTVTRQGARLLDWDNMGGGLKFLMDALVKNDVIQDDNPGCVVELILKQAKSSRVNACTVILIKAE